ncbi:MAG: hypothetical protein PHT76_14980 [Anaerostipes sp.]|nr:hypothetical protein [Anaerostipes sp.]
MSTKEKLAKREYGEESFVKLYQEEIDTIKDYEKDFTRFDELEADEQRELELDARSYYRKFARAFLELGDDRVTQEEALPICERFDELKEEFQTIKDVEQEKEKMEHEIHIQDLEEAQMNQKIKKYHDEVNNRHILYVSTSIMLIAAVAFTIFVMNYFRILLPMIILPGIIVIFGAVIALVFFYRDQKKSLEKEKLYGVMKSNRRIVSNRSLIEYENQCRKLVFYNEKYNTIFSYIKSEQWKLFGFCAKVLEVIESEELQKERKQFLDSLKKYKFQYPDLWILYTRGLYDKKKREELRNQWKQRIESCEAGIKKHTKNIDRGEAE